MKKTLLLMVSLLAIAVAGAKEAPLSVEPKSLTNEAKYASSALDYTQITALEVTGKGRLWASVLCGGDNADGFLTLAYSDTQGKSWVEQNLVLDARAEKRAVRNGILWRSPKGDLWLFYSVFDGYYDGRGAMWAMCCNNPNAKQPVWNAPKYLGVGIPTGRPVVNKAGKWFLPVALWGREVMSYDKTPFIANKWNRPRFVSPYADKQHDIDSKRGAGVYISSNKGGSWRAHLGCVQPADEWVAGRYNNPQLFINDNNEVQMVLRVSGTTSLYTATSANGKEWSEPEKFVLAPDQNFAIHRLSNGSLLMVRNGHIKQTLFWRPTGMYAYLSDDNGENWYGNIQLSTGASTINPVVTEGKDGTIYIVTHSDPEGLCVNRLYTTSKADFALSKEDSKHVTDNARTVLTAGKAKERVEAELRQITAPKTDWASEDLRLATYNIQYPGKRSPWPPRIEAAAAVIKEYRFDIFGAQEPWLPQINDLMKHIGDEYDWIGSNISGDDRNTTRHFNPIFYRRERLELLDHATIWLSDKAAKRGYGAHSARLFTWAKFRDKRTGKEFFIFNGHYDHRGKEARLNASHIILDMIRRISKGAPTFVTADYNSPQNSLAYRILHGSPYLKDAMTVADRTTNKQYRSCTHYKPAESLPIDGRHIDHIFVTPNSIRISNWELIIKDYDGVWGSDHLPVYVDCRIAN